MWMLLGLGAIVFAALNVMGSARRRDTGWLGYASLSLTALTLCAFYSDGAGRVVSGDWSGLMDIMPTASTALWLCTLASILINSAALLRGKNKMT